MLLQQGKDEIANSAATLENGIAGIWPLCRVKLSELALRPMAICELTSEDNENIS